MSWIRFLAALLLLFVASVQCNLRCYECYDCVYSYANVVPCGTPLQGNTQGPGYPTYVTPPLTYSTATTWWTTTWWTTSPPTLYPPVHTTYRAPTKANNYLCYWSETYEYGRQIVRRGCALQMSSFEQTCRSITSQLSSTACNFCSYDLCNS